MHTYIYPGGAKHEVAVPLGTPALTCQLLNVSAIGYFAHLQGQPLGEKLSVAQPLSGRVMVSILHRVGSLVIS